MRIEKITHAVAEIEPIRFHEKVSPILKCSPETTLLRSKADASG